MSLTAEGFFYRQGSIIHRSVWHCPPPSRKPTHSLSSTHTHTHTYSPNLPLFGSLTAALRNAITHSQVLGRRGGCCEQAQGRRGGKRKRTRRRKEGRGGGGGRGETVTDGWKLCATLINLRRHHLHPPLRNTTSSAACRWEETRLLHRLHVQPQSSWCNVITLCFHNGPDHMEWIS